MVSDDILKSASTMVSDESWASLFSREIVLVGDYFQLDHRPLCLALRVLVTIIL